MKFINQYLKDTITLTKKINKKTILKIVNEIKRVKDTNGRIFVLGNGGSAATASHAVNDFRKLNKIAAYAPSDSIPELTARANDDGYHTVFSNWLAISKPTQNDLLLILSVSGNSSNLLEILGKSIFQDVKIISILGSADSSLFYQSDIGVAIEAGDNKYGHVEGLTSVILHMIHNHPELL